MGLEKVTVDVEKPGQSSLEKALDVCETLAGSRRGLTVTELARALRQPPSTVHRLLAALKRRGYVRQDEETTRYSLTLKMLDLSFRLLGRSELRLHGYPVLREYVLRTGMRAFVAVPHAADVTYLWGAGPDAVGMHTTYGRQMPVHCAMFVDRSAARRLTCLRLEGAADAADAERVALRFGPPDPPAPLQRLLCTCAPVRDYTGQEVARVGLYAHAAAEQPFATDQTRASIELSRLVSMRLGHLPTSSLEEEFGARDPGLGTRDSGLGTRDSGLGTRDSGLGARGSGLGARDSGHGTRDWGLGPGGDQSR